MELKLKDREFWYNLQGQIPGLLDWDMENELFLSCTTDQCSLPEQALSKYRIRVMKPPEMPQKRRPSPDKDGPHCEPNLWIWVNPNILCPLDGQKAPKSSGKKDLTSISPFSQPSLTDEESNCSEVTVVESLSSSSSEQSPIQKQGIYSHNDFVLTEEEAEKQEDDSFQSPEREFFQSQNLWQINSQEKSWQRIPLNCSHLIALALRKSPHCGLSVQEIYSFTRHHFPFFWTAPDGWKGTIHYNLCFLSSFEKVPDNLQDEDNARPCCCRWRLTKEGHRRFWEETRALAAVQRESIQECMSQPELFTSLFDL
ncbi:forkhead box protein R2 [Saimiri boliviensis]|uniref:forkhead box protein R2 n=1 Tax=Saimiri boliviensis TaxID=27679 RepID=UPI00027FC0A1|nr:forkhead box protein R2 [Saimiri boliviensis boliviensis]